jgi:hypothetical protein
MHTPAPCFLPARSAHVEVRRALHQNSMCRAPLLNTQHSKAELAALYRLHLEQAEVPADFGTLLQLRRGRGARGLAGIVVTGP